MSHARAFRPHSLLCLLCLVAAVLPAVCIAADYAALAKKLLSADGVRRGVCLHIGCGDGRLTAALGSVRDDIVHGVDSDAASVLKTQAAIRAAGAYGRVSADSADLAHLPYADEIANVVVVDDAARAFKAGLTVAEILRVLAPMGTAFINAAPDRQDVAAAAEAAGADALKTQDLDASWLRLVKRWPTEIDEWRQPRHNAARTAISADKRIGPVTGLAWLQGEEFSRLWTPLTGVVSANGRNFYLKKPLPGATRGPSTLEARDAFNGTRLWELPCAGDASALVAVADTVYTRLKTDGPVVALDAATGKTLRTFDIGGSLTLHSGELIVRVAQDRWDVIEMPKGTSRLSFRVPRAAKGSAALFVDGAAYFVLAAEDGAANGEIVCMEYETGKLRWRAPNTGDGLLYWCRNGLLLTCPAPLPRPKRGDPPPPQEFVQAFSTDGGKHLWEWPLTRKKGGKPSAFYMGDVVWIYDNVDTIPPGTPADAEPPEGGWPKNRGYVGLDPLTGRNIRRDSGPWKDFGRCGPDLATERYILGMDMSVYDMANGMALYACHFARGDCQISYLPANGMMYNYGHQCSCNPYIGGVAAMSPRPLKKPAEMTAGVAATLKKGPAYGRKPAPNSVAEADWTSFRHGAFRGAVSSATVPGDVKEAWRAKLGSSLTPPVAAGDAVYVAVTDEHRVVCLERSTGEVRWQFTAGARIETPPTVVEGRVLVSARDGRLSCLDAASGELVWSLQCAPAEQRIPVHGQLESLWPLFGSAVVDGIAYVCTGRHSDADGGLFLLAIEPATGRLLWKENLRGLPPYRTDPHVKDIWRNRNGDNVGLYGSGTYNDVPISDGKTIFIGTLGVDIATRKATIDPAGSALFAGPGTFSWDTTRPADDRAGRNIWTFYTGRRAKRGGAARPITGSLLAIHGPQLWGVTHRRGRTTAIVSLFARPSGLPVPEGTEPLRWRVTPPAKHTRVKALAVAGDKLLAATQPGGTRFGQEDVQKGELWILSAKDGTTLSRLELGAPPSFDALAAAPGRIYLTTDAGDLIAFEAK
jgi:outer membrane protein assembly factor BamB